MVPDGQSLAFIERNPDSGSDIWVLNLDEPDPFPVVVTRFNERSPAFSPDGRWLAYDSDESGRSEVYVQPYPGPGPRWLISTDGGEFPVWSPVWSPEGLELFYRTNDSMMSVKIDTVSTFTAGIPSVLFELPYTPLSMYDVTRDGQHFVMITENQKTLVEVNLVLGWLDELNRLAPPSP